MRLHFIAIALAALYMLGICMTAQAQYPGAYGGTGGYGSGSPYGSSLGQAGMFGSRTLGTTLTPGQRTFSGLPGSSAMSGNPGGQMDSSARFLRQNRQPGQFVGVSPETFGYPTGNVQAGPQGRGMPGLGGFSPGMSPGRWNGSGYPGGWADMANIPGEQAAGGKTASPVRIAFRAAFEHPSPTAPSLSKLLAARLADTSAVRTLGPIEVEVQGQTAILRGSVATDHDRALAEQLVRLEAGIEQVKNELVVARPGSSKATTP